MQKLLLQLIAELQRLGATVVHAGKRWLCKPSFVQHGLLAWRSGPAVSAPCAWHHCLQCGGASDIVGDLPPIAADGSSLILCTDKRNLTAAVGCAHGGLVPGQQAGFQAGLEWPLEA